jgi:hypothetical protein
MPRSLGGFVVRIEGGQGIGCRRSSPSPTRSASSEQSSLAGWSHSPGDPVLPVAGMPCSDGAARVRVDAGAPPCHGGHRAPHVPG